jgi:hypothetical protein
LSSMSNTILPRTCDRPCAGEVKLAPNLVELKRRPEEFRGHLKAKQSDIANKLNEPCQSGAFLPRRLKVTRASVSQS